MACGGASTPSSSMRSLALVASLALAAARPPKAAEPAPSPPSPPPSPVAVIVFDPHLSFAHGGKADLKGIDSTWYNLLSAKNTSLNVLFNHADFHLVKPRKQLVHGSRMQQLCMTVRTYTGRVISIEFNATTAGEQHARVNQLRPGPMKSLLTLERATTSDLEGESEDGLLQAVDNVELHLRAKTIAGMASMALSIDTGKWLVHAESMPFPNARAHPGKALLNVRIEAKYDADHDVVAPHGLIGQSYDGDNIAIIGQLDDYSGDTVETKAMAEGAIEGVAADYAMGSKYATNFKFSRFDATHAKVRDVSALSGAKVVLDASSSFEA